MLDQVENNPYIGGDVVRCADCGTVTLHSVHGGLCTDCHANTRPARPMAKQRKHGIGGHRSRGMRRENEGGIGR